MRVRPASPADLRAAAELVRDHPLFARYGLEPERLERALATASAHGDAVLLAVDDGAGAAAPLGLAWWTPRGAFARSPYLRLLLVGAAATGRGVGADLMDAVEAAAFAEAGDLFALANVDNTGARRFYARRGFAEVGRLDDYVAPGLHEVLLRKRRPAAG